VAPGEIAMMRRFLYWFFRNRETGEVTIAQAPNLVLWIAIAAGVLLWVWPPAGNPGVAKFSGLLEELPLWLGRLG
jgi:uncharacterized membrane protein YhhN